MRTRWSGLDLVEYEGRKSIRREMQTTTRNLTVRDSPSRSPKRETEPLDAYHTFILPLPPAKCSPNARGVGKHWAVKARAVKGYRETCGLIIKRTWGRRDAIVGMVTVDFDFYLCRGIHTEALYLPRDRDNALSSAKAAIDSLKDAGVIHNDSKKYVTIGKVNLYTKAPEHQNRSELVLTLTRENQE